MIFWLCGCICWTLRSVTNILFVTLSLKIQKAYVGLVLWSNFHLTFVASFHKKKVSQPAISGTWSSGMSIILVNHNFCNESLQKCLLHSFVFFGTEFEILIYSNLVNLTKARSIIATTLVSLLEKEIVRMEQSSQYDWQFLCGTYVFHKLVVAFCNVKSFGRDFHHC